MLKVVVAASVPKTRQLKKTFEPVVMIPTKPRPKFSMSDWARKSVPAIKNKNPINKIIH
jgi:hypothetical protein